MPIRCDASYSAIPYSVLQTPRFTPSLADKNLKVFFYVVFLF